jgi:hypothetical protein
MKKEPPFACDCSRAVDFLAFNPLDGVKKLKTFKTQAVQVE